MTIPLRDLASTEYWERSRARSLHRRAITPEVRRRMSRRKRASAALSTLMVAGPAGQVFAATGGVSDGKRATGPAPVGTVDPGASQAMMFRLGSTGTPVQAVQDRLGIPADGIFGPVTDRAVRDFQAANGLLVDGIVGPVTWTKLFGLEDAAMGAGAADGDVAVIIRERPAAGPSIDRSPARASAGDRRRAGGEDEPGPTRVLKPRRAVGGDVPVAQVPAASPAPMRTRPVSTAPAPTRGACGSLRLSAPVKGLETSPFGPRGGRNHDGVDIAAPEGTPVRAAECGIVSFAGVQSGYGNMVCVQHSDRLETCYAHLSRFASSDGQRVRKGQVIGYVGCTGSCTGPHVHFETRVDGNAQDPTPYLRGRPGPGTPTVRTARAADERPARGERRNGSRATMASAGAGGGAVAQPASGETVAASEPTTTTTAAEQPAAEAAPVAEPVTIAPAEQAPVTPVAEPAPVAEPVPVAPAPAPVETVAEPAPVEAAPVPVEPVAEPVPVEPVPVAPVAEPAPVEPAPVEPAPDEAAPVEPVAEPVPVEPVAEAVPVEPVAEPVPVEPVAEATPVEEAPVDPTAEAVPVDPTLTVPAG